MYTDLEINVSTQLPYIYKISNAKKFDSAVMYIQKDTQSNEIYPLHYIKNIALKTYKSQKSLERTASLDAVPKTEESDNNDLIIGAYFKAKQVTLSK